MGLHCLLLVIMFNMRSGEILWASLIYLFLGGCIYKEGAGRNVAADAVFYPFHKDEIGLDTDATIKWNCDEAKEREC